MYGTQDASATFQDDYKQRVQDRSATSMQWCDQDAMKVLDGVLRRRHELKITGPLGMSSDESHSEVKFLNRVLLHGSLRESSEKTKTVTRQ